MCLPAGATNDKDVRKAVVYVLSKCQPGDWFVLNQLGKNVNTYFFRAFMKELRAQVNDSNREPAMSFPAEAFTIALRIALSILDKLLELIKLIKNELA